MEWRAESNCSVVSGVEAIREVTNRIAAPTAMVESYRLGVLGREWAAAKITAAETSPVRICFTTCCSCWDEKRFFLENYYLELEELLHNLCLGAKFNNPFLKGLLSACIYRCCYCCYTGRNRKWVDNVLSHHRVAGVHQARQGILRRVTPAGLLNLEIALSLGRVLGVPIARALDISND
jgi:hypothetical protein